jgi:hypothetical protein
MLLLLLLLGNYTEWLQAKAIRLEQEAKRDRNRVKLLGLATAMIYKQFFFCIVVVVL